MVLRVRSILHATPTSRIVRLDLGHRRFAYRVGQAVLVGVHGQPRRKAYSMTSAPGEARARGYLEFLIKTGAAGRFGLHLAGLRRGALVDVEGRFGSLVLPDVVRERRLLLIAGGTGVAPLRAMLHHALGRGYRGRVTVLYSARSPRHFAYAAELRRLARQRRIALILTVTRHAPHGWRGRRGRIALPLLASVVTEPATLCFVCGPSALVVRAARLLRRLGVAARRIRTERWKA